MSGNGRIAAGQKLSSAVSARAWNRAQDAADLVLGSRGAFVAGESDTIARAANVVLVMNNSSYPVPVGGALWVSGIVVNPADGELDRDPPEGADLQAREFVRRPVLSGQRVVSPGDPIAVALEPVAAGAVGRFAVGGVFPCKVRVLSYSHTHATGRKDDVTQLVSASCGPVRLLFRGGDAVGTEPPDTEPKWSLGQM